MNILLGAYLVSALLLAAIWVCEVRSGDELLLGDVVQALFVILVPGMALWFLLVITFEWVADFWGELKRDPVWDRVIWRKEKS